MAVEPREHRQDLLDGCEDVGFGTAERGQPDSRKTRLEITDIVLAEFEVMHQVRRRTTVRRMGDFDVIRSCHLGGEHCITHGSNIRLEGLERVALAIDDLHTDTLRGQSERQLNTN